MNWPTPLRGRGRGTRREAQHLPPFLPPSSEDVSVVGYFQGDLVESDSAHSKFQAHLSLVCASTSSSVKWGAMKAQASGSFA